MARIDDLLRSPPSVDLGAVSVPNATTSGKHAALGTSAALPDVAAILDGLLLELHNRVVLLTGETSPMASATYAAIRHTRS